MKNKKFQYVIYMQESAHLIKEYSNFKRGFLLIEIMAALMAFAGISVLIARYHVYIIQHNKEVQNYLHAINIGCDVLEKNETIKQVSNPFRLAYSVDDYQVPAIFKEKGFTTERLKKLKSVHVKISWNSMDGQKKLVLLETALPDRTGDA